METTPNLLLPYIMAAQAQKHVTHNEAIRALDAVVQIGVIDADRTAPPAAPIDGERHRVAVGATGSWAGQDGRIAAWQDGAWAFYRPRAGWLVWDAASGALEVYDGADWIEAASGPALNPLAGGMLGVNATADATNRLTVSAAATLLNHDGAGHQVKINKAVASDTASLLLQTGYSGRAEIGTSSDDHLHVKVSADGASWHEAMVVDGATGSCSFPNSTLGGGTDHVRTRAGTVQDIFAMADAWNASETAFFGIKLDVTDTASSAGSRLLDLLVGGTSRFSVDKDGGVLIKNAAGTSLGGLKRAGNSGEMALTSLLDPGTGLPADVMRFYWENGAHVGSADSASVAVLRGMGGNRFSIESAAAMVHIAQNSRYEWEGYGTDRLQFTGYEAGSANGRPVEIGNSGQTAGQETVPLYVRTYVSGKDIAHFRDHTDATVVKIERSGNLTASGMVKSRSFFCLADGGDNTGFSLYRGGTGKVQIWDHLGNTPGTMFIFGSGASVAAVKGNGTTLEARLGDDSAYAKLKGKLTTDSAYAPGAPTPTGYLTLYDAGGTAYKVPAVAA